MKTKSNIVLATLLLTLIGPVGSFAQAGRLKVGAAKLNITPSKKELPQSSLGIHDSIYCRAIVIDNGVTSAAFVTVAGNAGEQAWKTATGRIEKELGIPAVNVIVSGTHSHSVGRVQGLDQKIFTAVKDAQANMQPARIGWGTGVSYINVKRDLIDTKTRKWWEGPNYDGASDKKVYVISFEALDGSPIAVYYNYAMHAVLMGQYDMISDDAPGAASSYIENSFDNTVVAVWSEGACGDQNPIYFQQTFDLRDIRIKDYAKRGEDISNAMPPGGVGLDRNNPAVKKLMKEQELITNAMGVMLGEEVKHVMRGVSSTTDMAEIKAAQKVLTFPGRKRTNQGRGGIEGTYVDGDSVTIRVGVLIIDDIAIGTVNGETYNPIATQFIKESPYAHTMMVTIANGSATTGYIPDDASFGQNVFEVLSSRLKPGYAERGIIDGILGLMKKVKK
jgi:neutral ceramidase